MEALSVEHIYFVHVIHKIYTSLAHTPAGPKQLVQFFLELCITNQTFECVFLFASIVLNVFFVLFLDE